MQRILDCIDIAKYAPSGKNRQPWKVMVLSREEKEELVRIVRIMHSDEAMPGSLRGSLDAIHQCDKLLLVFNPYTYHEHDYSRNRLLMDAQSIGAFIQNLLLLFTEEGISSLWLNDLYFAKERLEARFVRGESELIAGIAVGYAAEVRQFNLRKALEEILI